MKRPTFIFLLLVFISILGCYKKYPEDDFISFRSASNRISDNYKYKCWLIKRCKINGVDATGEYFKNVPFFKLCFINRNNDEPNAVGVTKDNKTFSDSLKFMMSSCGGLSCWYLRKKKIIMAPFILYPLDFNSDTTFYQDGSFKVNNRAQYHWEFEYRIIKLTNTQMTLKTIFKNNEFEIEFDVE